MWPEFDDYKTGMERWLQKSHPAYFKELSNKEWLNSFAGCHHSMVNIIINHFNHFNHLKF
jgi:hypothetical protein